MKQFVLIPFARGLGVMFFVASNLTSSYALAGVADPSPDSEIVVPTEDFANGVPATGTRSEQHVIEPAQEPQSFSATAPKHAEAATSTGDMFDFRTAKGYEYKLPDGLVLKLGHSFGPLDRVQFGGAYWFGADWALGFDVGYGYASREYAIGAGSGSRRVQRYEYSIIPEIYISNTLFSATTKRLLVSAGGGPLIRKAEGGKAGVGYFLQAGPGVDWPLTSQLSFHYEQWITFIVESDAAVGNKVGFQPQFSLIWWFQ